MFLARIISSSKTLEVPSYIEVTTKYKEDSVPTLIIGKKRAIDIFGQENVHVIDRTLSENVTWIYAKNERRADFESGLQNFKDSIEKKLNYSVKYYFVNIFIEKLSFLKKVLKWIDSETPKSVYATENHIYVYGGKDVIGFSLSDFKYIGIPAEKIIGRIASNPLNVFIKDSEIIESYSSKNKIIIPYIHFHTR